MNHALAVTLLVVTLFGPSSGANPCPAAASRIAQLERGQAPEEASSRSTCGLSFQPSLEVAAAKFIVANPSRAARAVPLIHDAYRTRASERDYGRFAEAVGKLVAVRHSPATDGVIEIGMVLPALTLLLTTATLVALIVGFRRNGQSAQSLAAASGESVATLQQKVDEAARTLRTLAEQTASRPENEMRAVLEARLPEEGRIASDLDIRRLGAGISDQIATIPSRKEEGPADLLSLERAALTRAWEAFCANGELKTAYEHAIQKGATADLRHLLLEQLPPHVPADLKPAFETALAPLRASHNLVAQLSVIARMGSAETKPLPSADQELARLRRDAHLLMTAQSGNTLTERLAFRGEAWIAETFVTFADLYLRRHQQACAEGNEAEFQQGVAIVKQVLDFAGLAPVEVKLGQTLFDATLHVGRSVETDARYADGVIVGVLQNGFVHAARGVICQPHVIVNRVR